MSGFPTNGVLAKFNSVTNATDLDQLIEVALKNVSMEFSAPAASEEVSGDGETVTKMIAGLVESQLNFTGKYPKASPRMGNAGLVTFSSGTVLFVDSWTMDFDFGEEDITSFASSAPLARVFMPAGRPIVKGSWTGRAVSGVALSMPTVVNGAGAAALFKLCEDSTDPAFSGNIIVVNHQLAAGGRGQQRYTYDYEFADTVTSVQGSTLPALLPAGAVDPSDWDLNADGVPDVTTVWQSYTNRTFSAAGYLRSLRVECNVGQVLSVSGVIKNSGAVTLA